MRLMFRLMIDEVDEERAYSFISMPRICSQSSMWGQATSYVVAVHHAWQGTGGMRDWSLCA